MKAKLLTFVRGLQTGTSPQFQSYLKSLTLLMVLMLGVGNVWGTKEETATLTFTKACSGSGTDDQKNSWTITSDAAESSFDSDRGIHYGTNSKAVSYLTLTSSSFTKTITKIVVNASDGSAAAKIDVTVGGVTFGSQSGTLTSSNAAYTFTPTTAQASTVFTGAVVVNISKSSAKKALYCKSVAVTYSIGGDTPTAPEITTHPLGATYDKGAVATALTIAASGNPTPTYQWYSNTTNSAVVDNDHKISGATNASYTPSTSTTGDTYYYCVATNSEGSATSNIAKVIVNAPKTLSSISVSTQPTKKSYNTCETLDLTGCVVKAKYSDNSEEDVTSSCTFNPANGAALTISVTSVAVSYNGKETSISDVSVTQGARDTFQDDMHGKATQYGDCNGYTIPSLDDETKGTECVGEHYKFIGWSSSSITSGSTTEPAGLLKAGSTHNADGTTYHAVWAIEKTE